MPTGIGKAPKALPQAAKRLWVDTFNGVFDGCDGSVKECDERAARVAWDNVKERYKKMGDKWVSREIEKSEVETFSAGAFDRFLEQAETEQAIEAAYVDIELIITKASLGADGTMRWQAVTSDTEKDKASERTSLALFRDWVERVKYGTVVKFLPNEPRMPFLGLSHYPAFDDGSGEAGVTLKMFTDGDQFKAAGQFHADDSHPIGPALFEAVRQERSLIKKGDTIDNPIRISAGWWDLEHRHGQFVFSRKSLTDICPMCVKGVGYKFYLKGQLDHFAATRVPMNPRTNLELMEKSMAVTTRVEDAASIVDPELAEETDRKAKLIGKANTKDQELHPAMVVRAKDEDEDPDEDAADDKGGFGAFLKNQRKKKKMSLAALGEVADIDEVDLADFEANKRRPGKRMVDAIAEALEIEDDDMEEMAGFFTTAEGKDKKAPPFKKGNKKGKTPAKDDEDKKHPAKASVDVERNEGEGHDEVVAVQVAPPPPRPFGGAISIDEAEGFMDAQERLADVHSNWDLFRTVVSNILSATPEQVPDKVRAMSQAISQFNGRINALKASLSDAFLLQSAVEPDEGAAEYEDEYEYDDEDHDVTVRSNTMTDQVIENTPLVPASPAVVMPTSPAVVMDAAIQGLVADKVMAPEAKSAAIQEALNVYTAEINRELERNDPTAQARTMAEAMKGVLSDVMAPLQESIGLLNAKLSTQTAAQPQAVQVAVPQQKSYSPGPMPQPVVPDSNQLPISSVTGKPSSIRAAVERTTLGVANGVN